MHHVSGIIPFERDYEISDKLLGRGAFSSVYECVNKSTGEVCAVKILEKKSISLNARVLLKCEMQGKFECNTEIYMGMSLITYVCVCTCM